MFLMYVLWLNRLLDWISATQVQRTDGGWEEYPVLGGQIVFVRVTVHLFNRRCSCTGGLHMKVGPSRQSGQSMLPR